MRPAIIFGDLELWLCGWLRREFPGVFVSNRLTDHKQPLAVVVRDDSGADDMIAADRRVAFTLYGENMAAVSRLARHLAARLRGLPVEDSGCPIIGVGSVFGPARVDSQGLAAVAYYLTCEMVVIGENADKQN